MNILLTSVGRRAYMVKYFKEVLGNKGFVHVCNSDEKSIAFKYADKTSVSPLIYDDEYIPFLLGYCKENKIDAVISLFDIDLLILAKHKKEFEGIGTKVIVSDPDVIELCNDKWLTYQFLVKNGFLAPRTYIDLNSVLDLLSCGDLTFPIIVKPRFGCGSISVSIAFDEDDLKYLTKKANREISDSYLKYESSITDQKVLYQEYLSGQEFGADIINDLDGVVRNVIIRKKIAMRSGETDIAELVSDSRIEKVLFDLGKATKHVANMDCDIFMVDDRPYILELNARFGGGYPFSHMGGCNLPRAIVLWLQHENVPLDMISARTGITGYKEISITEA